MSELNEVNISTSGNCFRVFERAFNARQALYVSENPELKIEVRGEVLLNIILEEYTETVCNAVEKALAIQNERKCEKNS
jgi:hypothetical protein